jgi:hypothetical protein
MVDRKEGEHASDGVRTAWETNAEWWDAYY